MHTNSKRAERGVHAASMLEAKTGRKLPAPLCIGRCSGLKPALRGNLGVYLCSFVVNFSGNASLPDGIKSSSFGPCWILSFSR